MALAREVGVPELNAQHGGNRPLAQRAQLQHARAGLLEGADERRLTGIDSRHEGDAVPTQPPRDEREPVERRDIAKVQIVDGDQRRRRGGEPSRQLEQRVIALRRLDQAAGDGKREVAFAGLTPGREHCQSMRRRAGTGAIQERGPAAPGRTGKQDEAATPRAGHSNRPVDGGQLGRTL